jgi:hypothetical protein
MYYPELTLSIGRSEGDTLSLMDIRDQYANEYVALTPTEKEGIVAEYESKRVCSAPPTRVTARSRVQDFAHTYQQISDLVSLYPSSRHTIVSFSLRCKH